MTAPTTTASGDDSGGQDATPTNDVSTGGDDDAPEASGSSSGGADGWGGPNASCPRSGNFTCGSTACDRGSQFCYGTVGGTGYCQPLSGLATVIVDSGTCGSCPTCDCIPPNQHGGTCTCFMDNYGGLTVACSQGGCYGSPPARLERAPLRAIG